MKWEVVSNPNDSVSLTLPDGSQKILPKGNTLAEVTESIGKAVFDSAIAAELNGEAVNLSAEVTKDARLNIITLHDKEAFDIIRRSCALILGQAVKELFPNVQRVEAVINDYGFYYDFLAHTPLPRPTCFALNNV